MYVFDVDCVHQSFNECHEDNLQLDAYNRGYNQLYNFFMVLGSVFGFIASDVREKIDILEGYRKPESEVKENYENTETMMLHEKEVNTETGAALHGSRTLLRLHRALKFTMLFLERLCEMDDNDSVCTVASACYQESLAEFHPWLLRNAAKLAMYTLPSRQVFIEKLSSEGVGEAEQKTKLCSAVEAIKLVYHGTEALYTKYELHQLP